MSSITWLFPETVDEALVLRRQYGDDGHLVAGGTFLGVLMNTGLLAPEVLIGLRRLDMLRDISVNDDEVPDLVLGGLACHAAVASDPAVRSFAPALAEAFRQVASARIRNRATVGGVLGDADYASDPPAMLAALGASVWLQSDTGVRSVPVDEFIVGHYETALREDEIITHVTVPPTWSHGAYWKFKSRSSEDRPCVGVATHADLVDGQVRRLRVVVGAVADRPVFLPDACARVEGLPAAEAARLVATEYAERVDPLSDQRGSSAYRRRIIEVGIRRSLEALSDERS